LESKLFFLEDKPEENSDSSLRALWKKEFSFTLSAEEASRIPLPPLTDQKVNILLHLIEQRLKGKSLAYIKGRQNFIGIELICDKRALIPKKETEILGKAAIELCKEIASLKQSVHVFDVCSCSGNLGLALAYYIRKIVVYLADLSQEALDLAMENISFLKLTERLSAIQSDRFLSFKSAIFYGNIDLIVCNPPNISASNVAKMDTEIPVNEPAISFD
jgi:release factor glutamine methyltransferase